MSMSQTSGPRIFEQWCTSPLLICSFSSLRELSHSRVQPRTRIGLLDFLLLLLLWLSARMGLDTVEAVDVLSRILHPFGEGGAMESVRRRIHMASQILSISDDLDHPPHSSPSVLPEPFS